MQGGKACWRDVKSSARLLKVSMMCWRHMRNLGKAPDSHHARPYEYGGKVPGSLVEKEPIGEFPPFSKESPSFQ